MRLLQTTLPRLKCQGFWTSHCIVFLDKELHSLFSLPSVYGYQQDTLYRGPLRDGLASCPGRGWMAKLSVAWCHKKWDKLWPCEVTVAHERLFVHLKICIIISSSLFNVHWFTVFNLFSPKCFIRNTYRELVWSIVLFSFIQTVLFRLFWMGSAVGELAEPNIKVLL